MRCGWRWMGRSRNRCPRSRCCNTHSQEGRSDAVDDLRGPAGAHHPGKATHLTARGIDAVIFDMDGVLADSEPLHQHVIRGLLAEYGVDWSPHGHDPTVGMRSLESFEFICSRHALPHDPRRLDALYTERVLPVLRARVTPMPGVPDVPRALAARGLRLAVASSSWPAGIGTPPTTPRGPPLVVTVASGLAVARRQPPRA